ncbi:MAG TPA: threonine ammonia-lyase [Alphaproteobacteria bacterium]
MAVGIEHIRAAAAQIADAVIATPTVGAPRLSAITGTDLVLKLENLQHTGSFKVRGALVKLLSLDPAACRRGVIAVSAGNHAQGVAYHARRLGIPATIVMPRATPFTKVDRTAALGAKVVLEGEDLDGAADHAHRLAAAEGYTFIHPYDDPSIIAGQGTVALEMLAAAPDLETIVVPIGGGGLIAGVATAARALNPRIRIIGVQAASYPSMANRMQGHRTAPAGGSTLAEGIAVKQPGELTGRIIGSCVDDILLVTEPMLERAVNLLATEAKIVAEGAGAASLAAVLSEPARFQGRRIGLIVSGGNIDARILASILMRGLARDGRIGRLRVEIPDAPGTLARVAAVIAEAGGNIVEIYHQRLFQDVPVTRTDLEIVVETRNGDHFNEIVARIEATGLRVQRLADTAAGTA